VLRKVFFIMVMGLLLTEVASAAIGTKRISGSCEVQDSLWAYPYEVKFDIDLITKPWFYKKVAKRGNLSIGIFATYFKDNERRGQSIARLQLTKVSDTDSEILDEVIIHDIQIGDTLEVSQSNNPHYIKCKAENYNAPTTYYNLDIKNAPIAVATQRLAVNMTTPTHTDCAIEMYFPQIGGQTINFLNAIEINGYLNFNMETKEENGDLTIWIEPTSTSWSAYYYIETKDRRPLYDVIRETLYPYHAEPQGTLTVEKCFR